MIKPIDRDLTGQLEFTKVKIRRVGIDVYLKRIVAEPRKPAI